jgi:uncharacterized coiled-coil DUF342 family protein
MEARHPPGYLQGMEDDIRAALARLSSDMHAGFTRVDQYFELMQLQYVEWRAELSGQIADLSSRIDRLTARVDELTARVDELTARVDELEIQVRQLRAELTSLRDWATLQVVDLRTGARADRQSADSRVEELEREADLLETRVTRLEQDRGGSAR